MIKENIISLCDLEQNHEATIAQFNVEPKTAKILADLGLTPMTTIKLLRKTIFCGPIEIKFKGIRLILGRDIASKILVKL